MKTPRHQRGYVCAPQFELPLDDGFCLVGESGEDRECVARELDTNHAGENGATQPELFHRV